MIFFSKLFQSLNENTLIITANKRLAGRILDESRKIEIPKSVTVMSLDDYLTSCWQQCRMQDPELSVLLNSNQEFLLWENIVNRLSGDVLLQKQATAYLARDTWQLLKQWNISLELLRTSDTQETRSFLNWANEFTNQNKKNNWIDRSSLMEVLVKQYQKKIIRVPIHIILVGFLELTPLDKLFFENLKALGCVIDYYDQSFQNIVSKEKAKQISCADVETEIYTMARWARHIYDTQSDIFVICVVPDLHQKRMKIKRIFDEVFEQSANSNISFNISAGKSFIEEPLIYIIFKLFEFKTKALSIQDIGYLLRSPFIGFSIQDFSKRALLDVELRDLGYTHYCLSDLITIIQSKDTFESFCKLLQDFGSIAIEEDRSSNEWTNVFLEILNVIGWPGERTLDNNEEQTIKRFKRLLAEFSDFDLVKPKLSFIQAVSYLYQLASQTIFQPEGKETSIQILGLLEAIGQPCTHTWIMGLSDHHFPAPAEPNPLLPIFLQKEYHMPRADADRELYFSHLAIQRLLSDSQQVIFSYPIREEDQLFQASALIQSFPKVGIEQLSLSDFILPAEKLLGTQQLSILKEDQAPPVQAEEIVRGGTDIFKQQAACPFRAFAKHRLHAKPLSNPEEGFNPVERGLLVHRILECFWKKVRSQRELLSLTDEVLEQIVKDCIQKEIQTVISKKHLSQQLIKIEKFCLQKLIMNWLIQEKSREYSFEVVACEKWGKIRIGDLTVKIQIDRIDRINESGYALIDYKTGRTTLQSWFGERPDEPQLPLYAISASEPIYAIAFAQIRPDEMSFKSISQQEGIFPGSKDLKIKKVENAQEDWSQQIEAWRQVLQNLANDFCQGKARVDPKDPNQTCRYCDFKTLCRIEFVK